MGRIRLAVLCVCLGAVSACVAFEPGSESRSVIGGNPTTAGTFAATGALIQYGDGMNTPPQYVACTGTLIAPDVVLTAAHCTHAMIDPLSLWR